MAVTSSDISQVASPLATQAAALARRARDFALEAERQDLVPELAQALDTPRSSRVVVVVCGERDSGKRAVVNALLDRPGLLPAADEVTTAAHVVIRGVAPGEGERLLGHVPNAAPLELDLRELAAMSTEAAVSERGIHYLELVLAHPLLAAGIVLVDTPGIGGLSRARGMMALTSLSGADAALLVLDGGAPVTLPELTFLREAAERVDDLVVALDRNDRQHGWQEIRRETEEHLARLERLGRRSVVLPVSARMKTRADRLAASDAQAQSLAGDLARESGIANLSARLSRLALERAGALRAARLCRLSEGVVDRLRAREEEISRSADKGTEELRERLQAKGGAREDFARELPALRRRLNNDLRLVQKEADAASVTRLNELRRDFDKRLAEGHKGELVDDLEAELLKTLEDSLLDVRDRMARTAEEMQVQFAKHGASLALDRAALEPGSAPPLSAVELPPSATGKNEWMSRAPFAAGAVVINPLYAVVAVAGLLFDRHRVRKRAEREQLSRQLVETVNEARAQLSVAVHHALVNGQAAITEAFEDVAAARRDELEEEVGALKAQVSMSDSERARRVPEAEARLARLADLRTRIVETQRGAVGALTGGRGAQET